MSFKGLFVLKVEDTKLQGKGNSYTLRYTRKSAFA